MSRLTAAQLHDLWMLMRQAAEAEILPRFRKLGRDGVRTKSGPLDLVTDADEAAERFITAGIARLFPGAVVVGEEATAADRLCSAGWAMRISLSWSIQSMAPRISRRACHCSA